LGEARVEAVPVGRITLSQAVTQAILDRIRAGEYRPGDRLATEKGLMEQFGVGRNVAREAVQALVAMGLVEVRPGRGAVVIGVDTSQAMDPGTVAALLLDQTVDDLHEFRRLIEVEIATRAAERATAADIHEIRGQLDGYRDAVERGLPLPSSEIGFHGAIARASHNAIYVRTLDLLEDLLARARNMTDGIQWVRHQALRDHEEIAAAIEAHDPARAEDAMRRHMELATRAMTEARERRASAAAERVQHVDASR
jgi:GntR family transcriptional regulator, transcriptional repressor for pyruvate dehydrogenase complex